jgi:hypothetical protein
MAVLLKILTWLFLVGLAGSAVAAVLFIAELIRVTLTSEPKIEHHAAVEG